MLEVLPWLLIIQEVLGAYDLSDAFTGPGIIAPNIYSNLHVNGECGSEKYDSHLEQNNKLISGMDEVNI